MNEQFESIARRVRFDADGDWWLALADNTTELPCPTCHGAAASTLHVEEMPMVRIVGYREENGETIYRLECGHIVTD